MGRRKQTEIPGAERERDEELDEAAELVYRLTAERLEKHEEEKEARGELITLMRSKKTTSYLLVDGEERYQVTLEESEKVKVKKKKAEG